MKPMDPYRSRERILFYENLPTAYICVEFKRTKIYRVHTAILYLKNKKRIFIYTPLLKILYIYIKKKNCIKIHSSNINDLRIFEFYTIVIESHYDIMNKNYSYNTFDFITRFIAVVSSYKIYRD